jgi:hypothetical protein
MQTETEPAAALPAPRDFKLGFMSRRRRLRNRWNIHMRKDDRPQAKTWDPNGTDAVDASVDAALATVALDSAVAPLKP